MKCLCQTSLLLIPMSGGHKHHLLYCCYVNMKIFQPHISASYFSTNSKAEKRKGNTYSLHLCLRCLVSASSPDTSSLTSPSSWSLSRPKPPSVPGLLECRNKDDSKLIKNLITGETKCLRFISEGITTPRPPARVCTFLTNCRRCRLRLCSRNPH